MTIRGHRDQEGNIIEQPYIVNAIFQEAYKHGLFCNQACQKYMQLLPVSRDQKAHSWQCACKCITIENLNVVFDRFVEDFKEIYSLHKLDWDSKDRSFDIESAVWISPNQSRVNAKRKVIHETERHEILANLQNAVSEELGISFELWEEYFQI
jgi:hypothetical protein